MRKNKWDCMEGSTFITSNLSTTRICVEISTFQSLAFGSILTLHGKNATPQEHFFSFDRRSMVGRTLPN